MPQGVTNCMVFNFKQCMHYYYEWPGGKKWNYKKTLPSPFLQSPHRRVIWTMIKWTVKINGSDHFLHITFWETFLWRTIITIVSIHNLAIVAETSFQEHSLCVSLCLSVSLYVSLSVSNRIVYNLKTMNFIIIREVYPSPESSIHLL